MKKFHRRALNAVSIGYTALISTIHRSPYKHIFDGIFNSINIYITPN